MRRMRHFVFRDEDVEINMTPMLDIVFIMLIFFIVTTSFVKESGITVNRPKAVTAKQEKQKNMIIGIKEDGEIWIDRKPVDIRSVRTQIEKMRAENPIEAVIIQADRKTTTGLLVRVMDATRMAGIRNISIATAQAE
jgi:biopolymer transport protein ExbD